MELLTPGVGLIVWLIVSLLNLVLFVIAVVLLVKQRIPAVDKLLWFAIILCIPIIGSGIYLVSGYSSAKRERS
ncbi:PLDc N-terminal domain-containing protein [Ohtaekwangia koreensis]|uniref:Phospholipase_D-nuclease N-terminal n=1 Tax=Ohtaekwangia koreensis TaxID=688867 RepID=A0A1T5LMR4_9BACT|nr:Phospholipase_D-nuclease N-terminal [Ohtaekwangia koreensis]